MSLREGRNFSKEVHTHEKAISYVRDYVTRFGAEIIKHKYESISPMGTIFVKYTDINGEELRTGITYGLPEDLDSLEEQCRISLEDKARFYSGHDRTI